MNFFKKLFDFGREERKEILSKLKNLENKMNNGNSTNSAFIGDINKLEQKPYSAIRQVDKTVIVVLYDEENPILTATDVPDTFYDNVKMLKTKREVKDFFNSFNYKEEVKDKDLPKITKDDFYVLRNNPDFVILGNRVELNGIHVPIPDVVLAEIISNREERILCDESLKEQYDKLDDYYNRLIYFWCWLANNPIQDRDDVLRYCINNDIRISPMGNIIAYRRVVSWKDEVEEVFNVELQDFVNEEYYKIVKKWKKKASDYNVYNDNPFVLVHVNKQNHGYNNYVGNLADLKAQGCEKEVVQLYTSWHDKGKYVFPIPSLYKINSDEVDLNADNCHSGGIHNCSVHYDYSSYGDTPVVTLVNPAKCIMVTPTYEKQKFRVSEMYIACINPNEQGVHIDEKLLEEADRVYSDMGIEELKEAWKNKSLDTFSIEDEVPETSLKDVQNIITILQNRIITIN
jgi:hypothetical protein